MTPAEVTDAYRRALAVAGEVVTVRRYVGTGASRPIVEAEVAARVTGYGASELAGNIQQGDRKVLVLADDLVRRQFPGPLKAGDKVVVGGRELTIVFPDDQTRRVAGVLVAYELQARG